MGSGMREIVINTQERAISPDINRLQKFKGRDIAELFRFMFDMVGNDDVLAGAVSIPSGLESPLRAEVMGGLMVQPQVGSSGLFIQPGVLYALAPDGAVDDSPYKYVRDAGIQGVGPLTVLPNSSGSIRIDVIECSIDTSSDIIVDSRDIFDETTNLFTPASVTKEKAYKLSYRVRAGTPAAGFPGAVAGWLPLAIASVPNGSVTTDTVTFWDVRPVISDREHAWGEISILYNKLSRSSFMIDEITNPGVIALNGEVLGTVGARRVGGTLKRGSPGTDDSFIDLADVANQEPGFTFPAANGIWFVYFLTPFGLPRWARYTDASTGQRTPRSPRGILVVSNTGTQHMTGRPLGAIGLPSSTGLGGVSAEGLCILASTTGLPNGARGGIGDGSVFHCGRRLATPSNGGYDSGISIPGTSVSAAGATFTLFENVHYPGNAKALYVHLLLVGTVAATTHTVLRDSELQIYALGGLVTPIAVFKAGVTRTGFDNPSGSPQSQAYVSGTIRVPVPNMFPDGNAGVPITIVWNLFMTDLLGATTGLSANLNIDGWELGP